LLFTRQRTIGDPSSDEDLGDIGAYLAKTFNGHIEQICLDAKKNNSIKMYERRSHIVNT